LTGEVSELHKRDVVFLFAWVLIVLAVLFIPIPIQAKIVEGEAPCPTVVCDVLKVTRFNFTFVAYNLTVTINAEGYNYSFTAETVTVYVWTFSNSQTEFSLNLEMQHCSLQNTNFTFHFDTLLLHVEGELEQDTIRYCVEGTVFVPIYQILVFGLENWMEVKT
jgi:hypothetical protein